MTDFHHRLEQEIPRLRRYARALTRNAVRADDLVQETLARALRKEHLWQAGTNLRAWLFTIMHNQNVNDVRRAMRDDTVDLENCSESLTATIDPTASHQLRELDHALAQLPEEHRQVILLVGLEGMSYEDAAAIPSCRYLVKHQKAPGELDIPRQTPALPALWRALARAVARRSHQARLLGRRSGPLLCGHASAVTAPI